MRSVAKLITPNTAIKLTDAIKIKLGIHKYPKLAKPTIKLALRQTPQDTSELINHPLHKFASGPEWTRIREKGTDYFQISLRRPNRNEFNVRDVAGYLAALSNKWKSQGLNRKHKVVLMGSNSSPSLLTTTTNGCRGSFSMA